MNIFLKHKLWNDFESEKVQYSSTLSPLLHLFVANTHVQVEDKFVQESLDTILCPNSLLKTNQRDRVLIDFSAEKKLKGYRRAESNKTRCRH